MTSQSKPYEYFDTPDGEDIIPKLWTVLKTASLAALALSVTDVMLNSKPKGYLKTVGRMAYVALPVFGTCTAFVITTNVLCNIRKQDDKINWAVGGLAAGAIYGAWKRKPEAAWVSGGALALAAIGKKYCIQNGLTITPPEIRPAHGTLRSPRHDWTLTKDPGLKTQN